MLASLLDQRLALSSSPSMTDLIQDMMIKDAWHMQIPRFNILVSKARTSIKNNQSMNITTKKLYS